MNKKYLFIVSLEVDKETKNVSKKLIKVIETSHSYSGQFTRDLLNLLIEEGIPTNICKLEGVRTEDCRDIFTGCIDNVWYKYLIVVNDIDLLDMFDTSVEHEYVKGSGYLSNKSHSSKISEEALRKL